MILGSGGQSVFQFLLFIFLARHLGPEAFGIIGIAAVFIELSGIVGRFGLTEVVIQRKELDEADASTAFWSSIAVGLAFTMLLLGSAGWVARFFGTPELEGVMSWLAPVSVIYAAGAVYEAKLRRDFGFRALAARNVSATFVAGVVALAMAIAGFGVYSLVAQRLIHVTWLLAAMIYSTRWVPSLVWKPSSGWRQLGAGATLAASAALGSSNKSIIDLIVGYMLGPTALGYLRIAWRALDLLLEVSIRPIASVILTSLSRLQSDRPAFVASYLRLVQMTAFFAVPVFFGAAVVANELILLMFVSQWQASVVPMQILTLTIIFVPMTFYKTDALMAVGAMRMVLVLNALEFVTSAVIVAVSARYGLEAAAMGHVLRFLAVTPVILWSVSKCAGVPAAATLTRVVRPVLTSALMAASLFALKPLLQALPPAAVIALLALAGLAVYLALACLVQRSLVTEFANMLGGLLSRRKIGK